MKRLGIITAFALLLLALTASAASAAVAPGTYGPNARQLQPRECPGQLAPHVGFALVHG
jgi:hypothetical protein